MKSVTSCILAGLAQAALWATPQVWAQVQLGPNPAPQVPQQPSAASTGPSDGFRRVDAARPEAGKRLNVQERAHLRQQLKEQYHRSSR